MPAKNGPLEGIRVVEWTQDMPGAYCGKLLADLGAEVIKIEEPEGDPIRRRGPYPQDVPDPERSAFFLFLNNNKLGITLDLRATADRHLLDGLLQDTDIFIAECPVVMLNERGLEYEALSKVNPQLIVTAVTPFGLTGPYKDYKTTDLVSWHLSGLGHATPGNVEDIEAEYPLRAGGRQADSAAGITAAVASLHALFMRYQTGRGQLVDASRLEAITAYNLGNLGTYSFTGQTPVRHKGGRLTGQIITVLPCSDGLVCLVTVQEYQWQTFLEKVLGNPEWASWEVFRDRMTRSQNWDALEPLVSELTRSFTKQELTQACLANRVPCQPVNTIAEMVHSPQLAAREFFPKVRHPAMGNVTVPRIPYIFDGQPPAIPRPAPLLGEHTAQVLKGRRATGGDSQRLQQPAAPAGKALRALKGIRVVDFTWVFAGPLSTRYLASMGAEVLKVESQAHPDTTRANVTNFHYSKKSVTINLSTPEGLDIVRRLIAVSDVVVENYGPGVTEKLGLTYADLKRINPALILISCSGFGRTGPESHYVAYGQTLQAYSGLTYATGYPGSPPRGLSAPLTDMITGTSAVLGVLSALYHRRKTGEGSHIDLSMLEATSAQLPEPILEYLVAGRDRGSLGNDDAVMAPHAVYRCKGEDAWLAIAVGSEEEWRGLCQALENPAWCADPRFGSAELRRDHKKELDQCLDAWTRQGDRFELMHLLQRHGVPAGVVCDARDVVENPHHKERGFFIELNDHTIGRKRFVGQPWRLTPDNEVCYEPAPLFGEDNLYVYCQVLGIPRAEYQRLVNTQIVY